MREHKRGDGRVFLRKGSKMWWAAYYLRGKEIRESTGELDEKKAEKYLRNRIIEVGADQRGLHKFTAPKNQKLTLHDLLESLKKDFELRGKLSPQNKSGLARAEADFGNYRAMGLTATQLDAYVEERLAKRDRPATINRISQIVGQAYRLAIRRGDLNSMPSIRHLSEAGNERKGFFSREEFDRVSANLPRELADFALFGFLTGWRKNEIASLSWSDIEDGVIRLRGENAKNGEARSVVIAGELSALIDRRKQARLANGVLTALVFHRDGEPVLEFRKSWASACVASGVGKMVCPKCGAEGTVKTCPQCEVRTEYTGRIFHDLRRSGVRHMVRAGVPQSVAMKISGHKTASMFRRYDIADEEDLRAAMESVAKYHEAAGKKVISMGQS
jgi:integrase